MLNQAILVGRVGSFEELNEKTALMDLVISRSYKNEKTKEYDIDTVKVEINGNLKANTLEYVVKGDLVGIKGRLENQDNEIIVIAEKVTFLSTRKENQAEQGE